MRGAIRALTGLAVVLGSISLAAAQPAGLRSEDFSSDPHWEGHRNRLVPEPAPTTVQNFGYRRTNFAGGKTGEIGGRVQRSVTPAWYAKKIAPRTLDDKLKASGTFSITEADGGSGVLFGWFNDKSRGWRTPNSLVFRIDGNGGKYWVFFEYGTRHWLAGGGDTFEGERYQTTTSKPFLADGTPHEWTLEYDPAGNDGNGAITYTLDGELFSINLAPGHKADGAEFNRFGMLNIQASGNSLEAWFDDVIIGGETHDFSSDPKWDARGNRVKFADRAIRPLHEFGHSDTSHAGGSKGELGGIMWRDESPAYYAAKTEPLSLENELFASGKLAFTGTGSDSGLYFGWFDSASKQNQSKPQYVEPPKNMLAIMLEGPSRIGHYFRPAYYDSTGAGEITGEGPVIRPDGKLHEWSMHYDPKGGGGNGQITVKFDDDKRTFDLRPGVKQTGATFDRFGFFDVQSGGHFVYLYVDDLTYTYTAKPGGRREGRQPERPR